MYPVSYAPSSVGLVITSPTRDSTSCAIKPIAFSPVSFQLNFLGFSAFTVSNPYEIS